MIGHFASGWPHPFHYTADGMNVTRRLSPDRSHPRALERVIMPNRFMTKVNDVLETPRRLERVAAGSLIISCIAVGIAIIALAVVVNRNAN